MILELLAVLAFLSLVQIPCWWITARSVTKMTPTETRPWNWRVLGGPLLYYPWLNRR